MLWSALDNGSVECRLCSHFCVLRDGQRGVCKVRINEKGRLYSQTYGKLIAESVDPVEKKPFFHFLPGSLAYSVASAGCNFSCSFCQNYQISQLSPKTEVFPGRTTTPAKVVDSAVSAGCSSISYTYTEPTVFFEFAFETSKIAAERGIKNNFVTNGYMSTEALNLISPYLDAANVDLKGDDVFYRKLCGARQKPVIENIRLMKELGIWVEVTTLLIPEYNDSKTQIKELAKIIRGIDPSIPWHISRFFPVYKMSAHYPTPPEKVSEARKIGFEEGLRYVYTGNMLGDEGENTYCYSCNTPVVKRCGYEITENMIKDGRCGVCGAPIDGVFEKG